MEWKHYLSLSAIGAISSYEIAMFYTKSPLFSAITGLTCGATYPLVFRYAIEK